MIKNYITGNALFVLLLISYPTITNTMRAFGFIFGTNNKPKQEHPATLYARGYIYYVGDKSLEKNYTKAAELFQLAANQGLGQAQYDLGCMYKNGIGVEQDYTKAIELLKLAANQKLVKAQYVLGYMYEEGLGVEEDYTKAAELYQLAANQQYAPAQYELGCMYDSGQGVPKDPKKALALLQAAANKGNKGAQSFAMKKWLSKQVNPKAQRPQRKIFASTDSSAEPVSSDISRSRITFSKSLKLD